MIQRCTNCGSPIAQGQRFCGNCGAQLTVSCPYCRITLSPPTKFCPNCGAALGGGTEQTPGWGAQPVGQPAPPGWGQQQPGWGQQQPGWGQQPAWTPQQAQPAQPSSSRPFLVLLLIILLLGLGGLAYFGISQFGWGDVLKGLLSSVTGGAGGIGEELKISNVKVVNIGVASAEITWDTNKPASTQVDYWVTSTDIKSTQETDIPGENSMGVYDAHSVKLTGLEPGTKYYFKVKSRDKDGQLVTKEGDFTTQEMPAE